MLQVPQGQPWMQQQSPMQMVRQVQMAPPVSQMMPPMQIEQPPAQQLYSLQNRDGFVGTPNMWVQPFLSAQYKPN